MVMCSVLYINRNPGELMLGSASVDVDAYDNDRGTWQHTVNTRRATSGAVQKAVCGAISNIGRRMRFRVSLSHPGLAVCMHTPPKPQKKIFQSLRVVTVCRVRFTRAPAH